MFVTFVITALLGWGSIALLTKEESKEEPVKQEADAKGKTEAKAQKEADEKAKKEQVKQAYLKEIRPEINNHKKVYDENWNNIFIPTIDAIANGSTDYYTAYNNMQAIKDNYQGGRNLTVDPLEGMDKADKKKLV